MAASVDEQLRDLREQADQARQQQARAQAEKDSAQRQLDNALAALQSEFGVTSLEQAQQLAESLGQHLVAEMQRVREHLQGIGG